MTQQNPAPLWMKSVAVFAILFGAITLFKAGGVLFGPPSARDAVGNFVPFVVQFNFIAGVFYVIAGIGIYLMRGWAIVVSALISVATILTATVFARYSLAGGAYETQTVGALAIRIGFWILVTLILWRRGRGA